MIKESIKNFYKQFAYDPAVENGVLPDSFNAFAVVAMGGSALAAEILKTARPETDLVIHKDYGLPAMGEADLKKRFFIFISYSGNTEEVISAFHMALDKHLSFAVIATGGKLLDLAKQSSIPFVRIPDSGIQPRMAVGFLLKALMRVMGDEEGLSEVSRVAQDLNAPSVYEAQGAAMAEVLRGKIPVVYGSRRNEAIARNWKIKFNETVKIPAFYNIFPELNHNEMTGFDAISSTRELSAPFHFIFLRDDADGARVLKRMDVCKKLYEDRGLAVSVVELSGDGIWDKIFTSLLTADWTAYQLSSHYGTEPEQVPMVEEFKKLIA